MMLAAGWHRPPTLEAYIQLPLPPSGLSEKEVAEWRYEQIEAKEFSQPRDAKSEQQRLKGRAAIPNPVNECSRTDVPTSITVSENDTGAHAGKPIAQGNQKEDVHFFVPELMAILGTKADEILTQHMCDVDESFSITVKASDLPEEPPFSGTINSPVGNDTGATFVQPNWPGWEQDGVEQKESCTELSKLSADSPAEVSPNFQSWPGWFNPHAEEAGSDRTPETSKLSFQLQEWGSTSGVAAECNLEAATLTASSGESIGTTPRVEALILHGNVPSSFRVPTEDDATVLQNNSNRVHDGVSPGMNFMADMSPSSGIFVRKDDDSPHERDSSIAPIGDPLTLMQLASSETESAVVSANPCSSVEVHVQPDDVRVGQLAVFCKQTRCTDRSDSAPRSANQPHVLPHRHTLHRTLQPSKQLSLPATPSIRKDLTFGVGIQFEYDASSATLCE